MTIVDPQAAARSAIAGLLGAFRFDPNQRRDRRGRWADEADLTQSNVDMTPDERQFLSDYVEDGRTYREVNDALRGNREMTPEMADKVAQLDELTARASLPGDAVLYRAMSVRVRDPLMGQLIEGEGTISDPGYGSASGDRDAVEDFKGTTDNTVVFEIKARAGQPVLVLGDDLSETAMMQTAQEVLLPRGYRLRIDKVGNRRSGGQVVWTVQATYEEAGAQPAITAAFNPNQRRDRRGRWTKGGGGPGASLGREVTVHHSMPFDEDTQNAIMESKYGGGPYKLPAITAPEDPSAATPVEGRRSIMLRVKAGADQPAADAGDGRVSLPAGRAEVADTNWVNNPDGTRTWVVDLVYGGPDTTEAAPSGPELGPPKTDPHAPPTLPGGTAPLSEGRAAYQAAQDSERAAERVEDADRRLASKLPGAVTYYTSDGYRHMNDRLRTGRPLGRGEAEFVRALDAGMAESEIRDDIALWRGIYDGGRVFGADWGPDSLVGAEWVDPSFVSTSARKEFITSFARESSPDAVSMRLLVPAGTQGMRVGHWGQEAEVLLGRQNRYRVVADYGMVDGTRRLDVEVIQGSPSRYVGADDE